MNYKKNSNQSIYQSITEQILEKLQSGTIPWQKPWAGGSDWAPKNLSSDKKYRGINTILLGFQGFSSPYWLTYAQARTAGGFIRKGAKGTRIIFWNQIQKKTGELDNQGEEKIESYPLLKTYVVFNLEQTEEIKHPEEERVTITTPFEKLSKAEDILASFPNKPLITNGGHLACYRPIFDQVIVPGPERFLSPESYYATLFHEIGHSTGHSSRLNREEVMNFTGFGSHHYSKEELTAEFTAAFLCGEAGIERTLDNSAAYIQSWLKVLKNNPAWLVQGAQRAQKAADFILSNPSPKKVNFQVLVEKMKQQQKIQAVSEPQAQRYRCA